MQELTYIANVDDNGVLKIIHRSDFDQDMKMFAGKKLELKIKLKRRTKTNRQNRYYWGCVIPFVQQGLYDKGFDRTMINPDVVHDYLKSKFLKVQLVTEEAEFIEIIRDYHDLTTVQHMDYVAEIQQWSAEFLGIYIPDPEKQAELPLTPKPL